MQLLEGTEVLVCRPGAQNHLPVTMLTLMLLTRMQQTVDHPLHARCMSHTAFCTLPKKKLTFQHNEFNVQEQGMGGTVYDRDTIMKKYMNGYDGKTLGHITLLLQRYGIVNAFVCLYTQPQPGY